jgi:alginate O-acetyltransferase complex protein AlgI
MLFQSPLFVLFFAGVLALLLAVRGRRPRHVILLCASYTFYAAWDVRFLALLVLTTAVDWVAGARIQASDDPSRRRAWLVASLVSNLGVLGAFKYFGFFAESAADLAALFGVTLRPHTLEIVLPVGISFYTFQSMSYTLDVFRRRLAAEASFLRFALYVAFFPQLVAGPIVRARTFLPQLDRDAPPRARNLAPGLFCFAVGLFKKVVIADHMARLADPVFADPALWGWQALALGVLAYGVQIYCDFSGYSDMAIGSARILGYRLPRNFDRPYAARSPREFWRRWHISLSTWLRDYLYVSLGGNRGGELRTHANVMLTMLLGGLWHGASWTFVFWGFAHGAGISADRALGGARRAAAWAGTLVFALLCWIPFRAASLSDAALYASRLLGGAQGAERLEPALLAGLAPLLVVTGFGQTRASARLERHLMRSPRALRALLAGGIVALAYALSAGEDRAFVYFQF